MLFIATAIAAHAQIFNTVVDFDGTDGDSPNNGSLVQGIDGNLYGATDLGGTYRECGGGCGTVYKVTASGNLATLYSFGSDGQYPYAGLTLAVDDNFYGTTSSGGLGKGTIYEITPAGELTTIYRFCPNGFCDDGRFPNAGIIEAISGIFYGTTVEGGAHDNGTVYGFTATHGRVLHSFCAQPKCADGGDPYAGLMQASNGNLYGMTDAGGNLAPTCGQGGCGTVFEITPAGKLTNIHFFEGTDGGNPVASLIQGTDGNLYGTTLTGGSAPTCGPYPHYGCGTIFKITPQGVLTTLHKFCTEPGCPDGANPVAGLMQGTDGNFYGTTQAGGSGDCMQGLTPGCGTVFAMTPNGTLTTLHSFNGADGNEPDAGLIQATTGIFYGTTFWGGMGSCLNYCGTIFSIDMGLGPFVTFIRAAGKVGQTGGILGQGFTGTTSVMLNGAPANFSVVSDTFIKATVPLGATTGYATVTTPSGVLTSNVPFHVIQ